MRYVLCCVWACMLGRWEGAVVIPAALLMYLGTQVSTLEVLLSRRCKAASTLLPR